MLIIETSVFTRRITALLADEEYRILQEALTVHPELGRIIPGSGGIRKLRWRVLGHGKRSGIRILYYWLKSRRILLMLFAFSKSERSDLTREQLRQLRKLVQEELK